MKNKILASISFLVVIALMFSACEKPPVEKANEDYDYSKIIPLVSAIAGPTAVAAHGLPEYPYTYSAPTRGGSTFAWTVTTLLGTGAAEITLEAATTEWWNAASDNEVVIQIGGDAGWAKIDKSTLQMFTLGDRLWAAFLETFLKKL